MLHLWMGHKDIRKRKIKVFFSKFSLRRFLHFYSIHKWSSAFSFSLFISGWFQSHLPCSVWTATTPTSTGTITMIMMRWVLWQIWWTFYNRNLRLYLESYSRQFSCRYDGNPAKKIKSIAFGNGDFNIWMLHFPILVVTELGRICSIQENLYLVLNSSKFKNSTVGSIRQNNKYGFVSKILTVCQQQNPIRSHFPCLYFTQPQVTIRRSKHVNFKWEKALKDQLLENDFCLEI